MPLPPDPGPEFDALLAEYQAYLDAHAGEFAELFDALLINVTAFFRNGALWEHLRTEVVPQLLATRAASPSACGARAARRGRRPTRSRSSSPR